MNISFNLDSTDIHDAENAARAARIMQAIAQGLTGSALVAEAAGLKPKAARKAPAKAAPAKPLCDSHGVMLPDTPESADLLAKALYPKRKKTTRKTAPKRTKKSAPKAKTAPKRKAVTVEIPVKEMGSKPQAKRTYRKRKSASTYSLEWLAKSLEKDAGFKREEGVVVDTYGFGSFLADTHSTEVWNRARLACAMMVAEKTDGASLRREFAIAKAWGVMPKSTAFHTALAAGAVTVSERMGKLAKALNINPKTVAAEATRLIPHAK